MTEIEVIIDEVLGVKVARGYAKVSYLAQISKADVYDIEKNPLGTQRDLSPKHAREAYEYIARADVAYVPEVFLNARDKSVINIDSSKNKTILKINDEKVLSARKVTISRVDGNHRLFYADGHQEKYPPLDKVISFCLALDLTLDQELKIFKDINDNQRKMSTSHLDNISIRTLSSVQLKQERDLYIADRLAEDSDSPFYGLVHKGGAKNAQRFIGLRPLRSGIKYMFNESSKLGALSDVEAQTFLIKNYFLAVKKVQPYAWETPAKFLTLRGAGFWATCFIGADVIDRCILDGKFSASDMAKILKSGRDWDWSRDGDFKGFSGRGGAVRIKDMVVAEFDQDGKVSMKDLLKKIADAQQ